MKRCVRQIGPEKGLLVARNFVGYGVGLVVDHERERVVARFPAAVSTLVDEYARVSRQYNAPRQNKSRGISPRHLGIAETATKIHISRLCWFFKNRSSNRASRPLITLVFFETVRFFDPH